VKRLLSYLPQSNKETIQITYTPNDEVREQTSIIPDNPNKPYDMHHVIAGNYR
jgi:propionyl-CoA carboxylase beta chain